jgi:dienelactone hydrolase
MLLLATVTLARCAGTMLQGSMRLLAAIAWLILAGPVQAATIALIPPNQIEIPSGDFVLKAQLFKPAGGGPFPTIIALHGCGGLASRSEPVLSHYRDWAERLVKNGEAVLFPDSYGSRGLGPQCRVKEHRLTARRERVADILAARQWLMQQPWARHDRISLIGWANGGSALLWAVRPQLFLRHPDPDFRSAIAFYPDCRLAAGLGWSARVPTLLLIGARDDISSPPACRQMIDGARGRSALTRIVVYPGAYHDFDRPNLPVQAVVSSPDASAPERGHVGTDPEARASAQKLVAEWLSR